MGLGVVSSKKYIPFGILAGVVVAISGVISCGKIIELLQNRSVNMIILDREDRSLYHVPQLLCL